MPRVGMRMERKEAPRRQLGIKARCRLCVVMCMCMCVCVWVCVGGWVCAMEKRKKENESNKQQRLVTSCVSFASLSRHLRSAAFPLCPVRLSAPLYLSSRRRPLLLSTPSRLPIGHNGHRSPRSLPLLLPRCSRKGCSAAPGGCACAPLPPLSALPKTLWVGG